MDRRAFSDRSGVKFWAWTVSIGLHLVVLSAFCLLNPQNISSAPIPDNNTFTPFFLAALQIKYVFKAAGSPIGSSNVLTIAGNSSIILELITIS